MDQPVADGDTAMPAAQLSPFFFAADSSGNDPQPYRTLLEVAKFADERGFTAVWTPERHFQRFGGLYGSPAVTSAALAVLTRRLSIRAGSVVVPLQHVLRIAEEWAMIDVLSGGRAALAVAFGWHVDDFVLSPGTYANRHEDADAKLMLLQRLWRGEAVPFPNGEGNPVEVVVRPKPIQAVLPMWLTGKTEHLFAHAAQLGHNILTANFQWKDPSHLARQIGAYRGQIQALHGHRGHVTLMVHTYVGASEAMVDEIAAPALLRYLMENVSIKATHVESKATADRDKPWLSDKFKNVTDKQRETVARVGARSYLEGPLGLIGTVDRCAAKLKEIAALGVDEVACLIDFGVGHDEVMQSMSRLATLIS